MGWRQNEQTAGLKTVTVIVELSYTVSVSYVSHSKSVYGKQLPGSCMSVELCVDNGNLILVYTGWFKYLRQIYYVLDTVSVHFYLIQNGQLRYVLILKNVSKLTNFVLFRNYLFRAISRYLQCNHVLSRRHFWL